MSGQRSTIEIDPNVLVKIIIEKSKAGKLNWQETVMDDVFIASVGGNTTIKVTAVPYTGANLKKSLTLLDEVGEPLLEVSSHEVPAVDEVFTLARTTALKKDERIQSFIEVLQRL